jgi:hypothetical protein
MAKGDGKIKVYGWIQEEHGFDAACVYGLIEKSFEDEDAYKRSEEYLLLMTHWSARKLKKVIKLLKEANLIVEADHKDREKCP